MHNKSLVVVAIIFAALCVAMMFAPTEARVVMTSGFYEDIQISPTVNFNHNFESSGPILTPMIDIETYIPQGDDIIVLDSVFYTGESDSEEVPLTNAEWAVPETEEVLPHDRAREFDSVFTHDNDVLGTTFEFSLNLDNTEDTGSTSGGTRSGGFRSPTTTTGRRVATTFDEDYEYDYLEDDEEQYTVVSTRGRGTSTGNVLDNSGFRSGGTGGTRTGGTGGTRTPTSGGGFRDNTTILNTAFRSSTSTSARDYGFVDSTNGFSGFRDNGCGSTRLQGFRSSTGTTEPVVCQGDLPTCTGANCTPALTTALNVNSLSQALRQIVTPIVSSLNGKEWVVRKSWPKITVKIVSLNINQLQISTDRGRLSVRISISVAASLGVSTKLLGSARTTASVSNYSIKASARISANTEQKIIISDVAVTAGYNDLNIHTTGGLIMKFVLKVASSLLKLKSIIRDALTVTLPAALSNALTGVGANMINTIPWKIKMNNDLAISLALVSTPIAQEDHLWVKFSGHTVSTSTLTAISHEVPMRHFDDHVLTPSSNGELFSVLVDEFVFNDYFASWYALNQWRSIINRHTQPQWLTDLNAAYWGVFFPWLDQYPEADLVMDMKLIAPPSIHIENGVATVKGSFDLSWFISNADNIPTVEIVKLRVDLESALTITIQYDSSIRLYRVYPIFSTLTPTFTVVQSIVGPVDLSELNNTLNRVINDILLPVMMVVINAGVPIPATANFQLANPSITFPTHGILIRAGVNIMF